MGFSRYVGRVGALAVVLGVGTVVAFPQTALADDGEGSGGAAAASSQESASGTSGAAGADSNVEAPTVTASDPTTNTTAAGTQDTSGDAPSSTVSAQTNTGSSTQTSVEPSTEPPSSPEPTTEPVVIEEPTGETPVTPGTPPPAEPTGTEPPTADPATGSDTAPTPTAKPDVPEASTPSKSTTEPAAVAPRSLQTTTNAPQQPGPSAETLSQRMTLTTAAALAPAAPALDPLSALLAIPVSIVTTLVNAVLTPFLGAPTAPAQPPLLWAVLAWVRREFQRTFANSTPTAPNQSVTISLTLPNSVSAPIAFGATDANGDRLTYTVPARGAVGGPTHGTVTVDQATGTFTYDPDDAYALTGGTDTFTYTVSDAGARRTILGIPLSFSPSSATGTVAVTLNRVNVAPVINGDDRTTLEDTPVTIAVLGNDTDANGNPLTVTGVTQATNGTTTFTASGVTYTPNANYYGTDSFAYTASDGAVTGTATVTVTVIQRFDDLVAVNDTVAVAEDSGTTVIDVLANDTDIDLGPKTITAVTQPTNGSVTVTGTTVSYIPNANFNGTDTFAYTVNGGPTATVTVTVTPVEDNPVAANDTAIVAEDSGTTLIDVLANDTDADGGATTITGVTQPTNGTVTFTGTALSYAPNANYNGTDTFTYTVNGGSTATATVTVTAVNDAPVAANQSYTTPAGTPIDIDLYAGAYDVDGDPVTDTFVGIPANGSNSTTSGGVLVYTPRPGFTGTDTFTYRLANLDYGVGTFGTVTITVTAVPPVAVNDTATVAEDSGTTLIDVLANDTVIDVEAGPKTITSVTPPTGGTVTFTGTTLSYTPNANFNGTDTFSYTLNGGSSATVAVTVTAINDAPVTKPLFLNVAEDDIGWYFDPFNGATDPDGDALILGDIVAPPFGSATPVFAGDQWLIFYKPLKDYAGPDNWSFVVSDGVLTTVTTVTVNLSPVNDPPVAVGDTATVAVGGTVTIPLTANDTDVDNAVNPATVVIVGQPTAGTVTVNPNGTVAYTSTGATATTDTFTYTVKDASGATSNTATVTISVTAAANTPPVAVNDTATVAEGGSTTISLVSNDTDSDGTVDSATVVIVGQPTAGTVTVNQNGTVTYASNGTEVTTDSFTYTVKDAAGATSNVATVSITVTPINDVPVAVNDTATVAEGGTTTIALITNDTDGDGTIDVTTVVIVRQPTAGTVTVNPNGTVTYVSNGSEVTADGFAYKVKDNSGALSNEATVTITITPVNDGPTAVNDAYTVAANGTLTVNAPGLLANDTDPDGAFLRLTEIFTPGHGTLSGVLSSGTFTYRPDAGYVGTDSFTYTVGDGAATSQGIVTITVTADPNNVAPVGNADSYTVNEDTVLTVNGPGLLANDTDANGQTLKVVSIGTEPTRGSLVLNDDGSFTYTPGPNLNGTDTFTYKASDGAAETAFTTVTINVTAVNDAPVINNDTIPIAKDSFVAFSLGNRSSDVDGDVLTGTVVSGPQHGTFYFDTVNRGFSYQPNAGYTGTDSFTYKVSDGKLDSAIATVTLTVA
ncbi:Ig-like domain-containing protein [Mycolicibacterium sp. GCM10028919]|uniref:beta strand repeat-containing protein n=1 Tax=Mycolicibacterium sp. GCM10028919 TaxID=3273401 RepID=UPI0036138E50